MEGNDDAVMNAFKANQDYQGKVYPCVWYPPVDCPIRTLWKLSPENLVSWCVACKQMGYIDNQDKVTRRDKK